MAEAKTNATKKTNKKKSLFARIKNWIVPKKENGKVDGERIAERGACLAAGAGMVLLAGVIAVVAQENGNKKAAPIELPEPEDAQ